MTDRPVTFVRRGDAPAGPEPEPAGSHVPEWFRNLEQRLESFTIPTNKTAKLCMPLNDAMGLGWMLRAPCDVHVRKTADGVEASADDGGAGVVTTVDVDQPDVDGNSAFYLPECLLATPWAVETPPGYSTLFTGPLNRDEVRFTVAGMLAPTDEYDGPVSVPLYVEAESFTIEAGEPIAQVVPVARDDLATETAAKPFGEDPVVGQLYVKTSEASTRRKDVYRKEAWVPKERARIVDDPGDVDGDDPGDAGGEDPGDAEGDDGGASPVERNARTTADGEVVAGTDVGGAVGDDDGATTSADAASENDDRLNYFCADDHYGALAEPVPAGEYVPDWYSDRLAAVEGLDADQPTSEWLLAAMSAGVVIPLPEPVTVRRTGTVPTAQHETALELETGATEHHTQHPLKMGEDHPLAPVTLLNLVSRWIVNPPDGFSVLVCSPFGHFQRYYRAYAGVGDFDRYPTTANTPGLFTGRADEVTLPARMPVSQHLPIARENLLTVATVER